MEITEIRVKLMGAPDDKREKLKAFCSVTLSNEIVIRDLKIIEGAKGLFVAMPSRKLMARCHYCGCKNPLRARHCNDCGKRLRHREETGMEGSVSRRLYADVAHPIHSEARRTLQTAVQEAYEHELHASRQEDYEPPAFEDMDYDLIAPREHKTKVEHTAFGSRHRSGRDGRQGQSAAEA
ncbi:MAG: SpoVG family protein [Planctomycetota bacterium]